MPQKPAPAPPQKATPAAKPALAAQAPSATGRPVVRLRRADRRAATPRRGGSDRAAADVEGLCSVRRPPGNGAPSVYRVRVGKFKTRREAETVAPSCKKKSSSSPGLRASRFCPARSSRSAFRNSAIRRSAGSRSRRCSSRSHRVARCMRAFSLGLARGRRLLHRHAVLDHARDGGVRRPAGDGSLCSSTPRSSRTWRSFPASSRWSCGVCSPPTAGRLLVAPFVWVGDRAGTHASVHRFSLGAARLQPGDGAADRAARQPLRRLRRVSARRRDERRACVRGTADNGCLQIRRRTAHSQPSSRSSSSSRPGEACASTERADARRRRRPRRADAGQRRAGREVGSRSTAARSSRIISA